MHYRVRTLVTQEYALLYLLKIRHLQVKKEESHCKIQETNVRKTKHLMSQNPL